MSMWATFPDVIVTDYGYFILRYAKDLESGEADFEARKETETEETPGPTRRTTHIPPLSTPFWMKRTFRSAI